MISRAEKIKIKSDKTLAVPDCPIIPFIEGDGIGPDIWRAAKMTIDAAISTAYGGKRAISWIEVLAGEKAYENTGKWLPDETIETIRTHFAGIFI